MLTKLSLVLYYHELFYVNQKWLKFSIRLLYLYILLWGIGTFFDAVFKCSPISYAWEAATVYYGLPPPETGTCQPEVEHIAVPAILSTISDVGLFLLPAVILSGLKMNTHEKLGLMALFSLGLFTIGVGIVRIVFCYQVTTTQDFTCKCNIFVSEQNALEIYALESPFRILMKPRTNAMFIVRGQRWCSGMDMC